MSQEFIDYVDLGYPTIILVRLGIVGLTMPWHAMTLSLWNPGECPWNNTQHRKLEVLMIWGYDRELRDVPQTYF